MPAGLTAALGDSGVPSPYPKPEVLQTVSTHRDATPTNSTLGPRILSYFKGAIKKARKRQGRESCNSTCFQPLASHARARVRMRAEVASPPQVLGVTGIAGVARVLLRNANNSGKIHVAHWMGLGTVFWEGSGGPTQLW